MTNRIRRICDLGIVCCSLVLFSSAFAFAQAESPKQAFEHGIQVRNIDRSAKPGDDFYQFANGQWLKTSEIPPDRAWAGVITDLDDLTQKRTAALIEELAKGGGAGNPGAKKIADLYNSYMNESAIEAKGLAPIQPHLKAIEAIKDKRQLALALGRSLRSDVDPLNVTNYHTENLFGFWLAPGFSDSEHYTAYLLQGGLLLPDREYYLADNPHMKEIRDKFRGTASAMFKLAGFSDPDSRASRVIDLETAIAKSHTPRDESEDVLKANNPWSQADFLRKAPGLDWKAFFEGAGLSKQSRFTVWQPAAFTGEAALVQSQSLESWKDWLALHEIMQYAYILPKALASESFAFYGKTLSGTLQQRPRWQRGINFVGEYLGDAVGQLYVQRYFPPQAKAEAQEMVAKIVDAFRKRIDALTWMNAATKKEAKAKLDTLYVGVGYPETWIDYSKYEVRPDDVFGNAWRAGVFKYQRDLARLGKPVDKHEWFMTPQTVNAVNLPLQNALNFPAAILQPPMFDADAPAAANYGAIGGVIGHEISHSFDSSGALFDSTGKLRNWWTEADKKYFDAATQSLVEQYNQYKPFSDLSLNGRLTLAENVADLAGVAAAYDAYKAGVKDDAAPAKDGYSSDQQFFIAYAQSWMSKFREPLLRQLVVTDGHSPSQYRAYEVRNIDAWYKVFHVKQGDALYLEPDKRVRIW